MSRSWLVPVAFASMLTGCGDLMFIEPLALDSDTTFDQALLGTWFDRDNVVVHVTAEKPPVYDITLSFVETGKSSRLEGRLVRLGDQQILDVSDPEPGLFSVPCHVWVYVQKKGSNVEIAHVDSQWLRDQLRSSGLPLFMMDKIPVTTASQVQLRAFAQKFGVRPEARGASLEWMAFRKKP